MEAVDLTTGEVAGEGPTGVAGGDGIRTFATLVNIAPLRSLAVPELARDGPPS